VVRPGVRRLSLGLGDQAATSLTTLCLSIGALRGPTAAAAEFAVVFIAYSLAVGFCRAITTEPRAPQLPSAPPEEVRAHVRASAVVGLLVGLLASLLCAVLLRPDTPLGMWSLLLPVTLVPVDAVRAAWIGSRRTDRAVVNSAVLLAAAVAGLVATLRTHDAVWAVALVVGATPLLLALAFVLTPQARVRDRLRPRHWIYALEWSLTFGQQQASGLVLAGLGLPLLPLILRAQNVVFGPLSTVSQSAAALSVPEFVSLRRRRTSLAAPAVGLSGLLIIGSALYGAVVLLLPEAVLEALLGNALAEYRPVLLASAVAIALAGATMGPLVAMRAHDAPRSSIRARIAIGTTGLLATLTGALTFGVQGYFWGSATASALGGIWALLVLRRVERSAVRPAPVPQEAGA
jgi:hypothetical protein